MYVVIRWEPDEDIESYSHAFGPFPTREAVELWERDGPNRCPYGFMQTVLEVLSPESKPGEHY